MVSVIIPVYNRAHYIKECLDSVLSQTYKDYEIIVVDDGSTDNVKEVLLPNMQQIRYIYKENGGAASARNVGIMHAKGDYIAWLDSDDRWLPFKLELQIAIFNKLPHLGFIYTDFSCVSNDNCLVAESYIKEYFHILNQYKLDFDSMFSQKTTFENLGIKCLADCYKSTKIYWGDVSKETILGPMFLPSSMLVNTKCIESIGLFNEKYKTSEDVEFNARLAKKFEVAYVGIPTTKYRRFHADQLSGDHMEIESNLTWLDIAVRLGKEDNDFYEKNRNFINWRISHCYYGIGAAYYRKQEYKLALDNFLKSLRINFKQRRIYLFTILSLVKLSIRRLISFLF